MKTSVPSPHPHRSSASQQGLAHKTASDRVDNRSRAGRSLRPRGSVECSGASGPHGHRAPQSSLAGGKC